MSKDDHGWAGRQHPSRRESLIGATSVLTMLAPSTAAAAPAPSSAEGAISLAEFGYAGDGVRDDTQAWRDAIVAAERRNVRRITVPWGKEGISLVSRPICAGTLPSGLTFEGEVRRHANPDQRGQRVIYTGDAVCWSIATGSGSPATVGQWAWRYLTFETTDPAAGLFEFNAGEQGLLHDGTGSSYIVFVLFESCYLQGTAGGARQTGDAIRATKTFSLQIDKQCQIRGWRRGVWLRGCDDCTIEGRLWLNARSIVHERSGTFGSNLQIRSNWLGRCPDAVAEAAYILHDEGSGTAIHGTFFEGHDHGGSRQNERALVWLGGFGTTLIGCRFAEGHCVEIAPSARETTIVAPGFASHRPQDDAIIHPPESWDFGFQQEDFRVLVVGASKNAVKHLGDHPRLIYRGRLPMAHDEVGGRVPIDMEADMLVDERGYRPRRHLLTAFNVFAKTDSTIVNGGARMQPDTGSSQGWVIACDAKLPQAGLSCAFVVGRDLMVGDRVRVTVRHACSSDGWHLRFLRNDADVTAGVIPLGGGAAFRSQAATIDLAGWTSGDRLAVVVLKMTQPHDDLRIDVMEIAATGAAVPPPLPVAPVAPVASGNEADVASRRSVNAAVDALGRRIDALTAALHRLGGVG